jgi:fluoride exporter
VREPQRLALVAVGGVVGALLRYAIAEVVGPAPITTGGVPVTDSWPWATLIVNTVGALAMGIAVGLLVRNTTASAVWSPLLITGLLGGFTTVSALALDTFSLINSGATLVAAGYFLVTILGGFLAVALGHRLAGDRQ